jgi:hypothetical protein
MKAQPEIFKGIEYVRISSLPGEQREKIWGSFQHGKIIKIVKDQALLNDCILYHDYELWLKDQHEHTTPATGQRATQPGHFSRLAFK